LFSLSGEADLQHITGSPSGRERTDLLIEAIVQRPLLQLPSNTQTVRRAAQKRARRYALRGQLLQIGGSLGEERAFTVTAKNNPGLKIVSNMACTSLVGGHYHRAASLCWEVLVYDAAISGGSLAFTT
jgi:hypothetical protein